MRVWIELDEQDSAWAQTRMVVAWLTHAGYVAQVLIGPEPKVTAIDPPSPVDAAPTGGAHV